MGSEIFSILYQDDDILVVEKQQAFLSQRSDDGNSEAFFELIGRTLKLKIYPVHRLDKEVLGIMIFGLSLKACDELSRQFREREVQKAYKAWVLGSPRPEKSELVHYLSKNQKNNHVTVYTRPTPGAKEARLSYEVLRSEGSRSLMKIQLYTGRSHQIRVQLSKIGHPIIGDHRYFNKKAQAHLEDSHRGIPIQLRSVELGIRHPSSGEWLEFHSKTACENFPFS